MASRESPGLADYVVIALSPILIMAMVGSLVFFLIDVLYAGQYSGRLQHTMFFFVAGAVLIARIAIEMNDGRATIYAIALGVVCWLALQRYVEYPRNSGLSDYAGGLNLILMGIVWWSAHKLTWDCTHIDEKQRASGKGILTEAGFDGDAGTSARELKQADAEVDDDVEVVDSRAKVGLLTRYQRFREKQRNKPHTPGVWVIYFAMAALPIFGLGQSLIPAVDADRRAHSFWLMLVYVGSALGLLVTTSFLGLRRYLRQRGLQMPATMTGMWLLIGTGLIAAFLAVGAILPRPHSETPIVDLRKFTSSDQKASKNAQFRDGAAKGEGATGDKTTAGKGNAVAKGGEPGGKGNAEGKNGSGGKGKASGNSGEKGESGKKGSSGDTKGKGNDQPKTADSKDANDAKNDRAENAEPSDSNAQDAEQPQEGQSPSDRPPPSNPSSISKLFDSVAGFVKWLVFGLILLAVVLFICFRGLGWLANFMPWAKRLLESIRNWWQSLFGGREALSEPTASIEEKRPSRPVPFSAFRNPFGDGSARRRELNELVRYSFAAIEAWGHDQGVPRRADETPLEFAQRLQQSFPELEQSAQRLVTLYSRLAYAPRGVNESQALTILESFWQTVETLEPEPAGET